ncbi:MAG: M30 family zinc metallopeptidase, partial [Ramlibacter sp.]
TEAGLTIPQIDARSFKSIQVLPSASPATLAAYGNFPVVRRGVRGTYAETVRVPTGTVLSVVIR